MDMDRDTESRRNTLTASIDCLRDLFCAVQPGLMPDPYKVGSILELIAAEAHALLDEPERGYGAASND